MGILGSLLVQTTLRRRRSSLWTGMPSLHCNLMRSVLCVYFTSEINLIPLVYTPPGFLTPLTPTPTLKNPYPECGYGFWSGRGRGRPELPQGYPCGSPWSRSRPHSFLLTSCLLISKLLQF